MGHSESLSNRIRHFSLYPSTLLVESTVGSDIESGNFGTTPPSVYLDALVSQVDMEMPGASWVELPKGTYSVRSDSKRRSRCQLEVDVCFNHIKSHPCKGEWNKVAPLRILSFDIECAGRKGHFPEVRQCDCSAAVSSSIREATALPVVDFSRSARPGLLCRMQQHAMRCCVPALSLRPSRLVHLIVSRKLMPA